jgi:4-hydroxy-tetrahydrodipicolinate synthase
MKKRFTGTTTALITPFYDDYSVDFNSLEKLIDYQIENGVDNILVSGSTGESATLSAKEKQALIIKTVEHVNKRVPVIVGTGSNSTQASVDMTIIAKEYGADAALLVAPYYNKPSQDGLYNHYYAIADSVDIPQIIYNVPGRSGVNIHPDIQLKLAEDCENIIATKEASGDMEQIMQIIKYKPDDFIVLSGDDAITLPLILLGAEGVISVLSNYAAKKFSDCVNLAIDGNYTDAVKIHYELMELMALNFVETNPAPVKAALNLMGLANDKLRLPLLSVSEDNKQLIKNQLEKLKLI